MIMTCSCFGISVPFIWVLNQFQRPFLVSILSTSHPHDLWSVCYGEYPFNSYFVYLVINILDVFFNKMLHIFFCAYPRVIIHYVISCACLFIKLFVLKRDIYISKGSSSSVGPAIWKPINFFRDTTRYPVYGRMRRLNMVDLWSPWLEYVFGKKEIFMACELWRFSFKRNVFSPFVAVPKLKIQ